MTRMEPFRSRPAGKLSGGMKQKLALMCTLLHHPQILFLDEPTNGVDPVSRRDFWAILYQLVQDGLTVFVTTAYLDEAERCNRVGLMHQGRLIHCDTPAALKKHMAEVCYEVTAPDRRAAREFLEQQPGILSVEASGPTVHLFLVPRETSADTLKIDVPRKIHESHHARSLIRARFVEPPPSRHGMRLASLPFHKVRTIIVTLGGAELRGTQACMIISSTSATRADQYRSPSASPASRARRAFSPREAWKIETDFDSDSVRSKNSGLCRASRLARARSSRLRSAVACGSAASSPA